MAGKYWENEQPEIVETKWMILEYYRQAGKLRIIRKIIRDGGTHFRTLTIDRRDIKEGPEVLRLLESALQDWKN